MTIARLEAALARGESPLPETGRVLVLQCDPALAAVLPSDRCDVVHSFAPDAAAWAQAGFEAGDALGTDYAGAIVQTGRSRDHSRQLVAKALSALAPGGVLLLDGQKTDGIEPLLKALKLALGPIEATSKAHGKLAVVTRPEALPEAIRDWSQIAPTGPDGWHTGLGGFSAEAIDKGSRLLVEHLPVLKGKVCDLGAGWGYLSKAILAHPKVTQLDLVEAERAALDAARKNIDDPRAQFHWADALTFGEAQSFEAIVMNPPFHAGRAAEPQLGVAFIARARVLLKKHGTLALVANRHLPYERALNEGFAQVQTISERDGFKVIHASRPKPRGKHG